MNERHDRQGQVSGAYSLAAKDPQLDTHSDHFGQSGYADHSVQSGHDGQASEHGSKSSSDHNGHHGKQHSEQHSGHHSGHGDHVAQFRRLFWIMLVIAVPVIGLSEMFAMIIGYQLPHDAWLKWVSPLLGTVVYAWGGKPFLTGAVSEIKSRKPGMMLLIALAITVAFVSSWG